MTNLDSGADLHALMDRALTDLPTPVERLHDGAVRRGRPSRRRRRAGAAIGGLALAAAAVAITLPALSGDGGTPGGVATDPGTPSPPGVEQPVVEQPAGWWDMPGRVMERRLEALLPADLTITDANLGDEDLAPGEQAGGGWVSVDLANAEGVPAGGLNVVLYPPFADGEAFTRERITCPGNLEDPSSCIEMHDESGEPVGRSSRWRSGVVVIMELTRLLPDGALVYASASNSSDDKWGQGSSVDATQPPVGMNDLKAIALSSSWQDWAPKP